jgi:hypothetical protein
MCKIKIELKITSYNNIIFGANLLTTSFDFLYTCLVLFESISHSLSCFNNHEILFLGFGLLGCCAVTFLIMFVPKSRQLSAIGKEGIYLEDQVDISLPYYVNYEPFKTYSISLLGRTSIHNQEPRIFCF